MKELETKRNKQYVDNYKTKQPLLDPERIIHSPELYAVWNIKHYLIEKISNLNPFKSKFFIYSDSGAWRRSVFSDWPDENFVRNLAIKLNDRMLYGQVGFKNRIKLNTSANLIQGTFFAGSQKAIKLASGTFYELHDKWLEHGKFVGKDQSILNEMVFIRAEDSVARLRTIRLNCSKIYNAWFFYQLYFAKSNVYFCSEAKFSLIS